MTNEWIDVELIKRRLGGFFQEKKTELNLFGSTVNQTFEAFVFAQVIRHYQQDARWRVEFVHPQSDEADGPTLRLKYSTRGRPENYTYARCRSDAGETVQIRHQLRVATRAYDPEVRALPRANICLDIAVIRDCDVSDLQTDMHVNNSDLVTFGEAKHMSAFAELVAGFVGLVHEMQPERLKQRRPDADAAHPSPFLFVSGHLWATAKGLLNTIEQRGFDICVHHQSSPLAGSMPLPTRPAPAKVLKASRSRKRPARQAPATTVAVATGELVDGPPFASPEQPV